MSEMQKKNRLALENVKGRELYKLPRPNNQAWIG